VAYRQRAHARRPASLTSIFSRPIRRWPLPRL
jgi:hypothetical protein